MRFWVGVTVIALLMAGCTQTQDDLQLDDAVADRVEPATTELEASGVIDPTVAFYSPLGPVRPIGSWGSSENWPVAEGHDVVMLTGTLHLETELANQHRVLVRFVVEGDTESHFDVVDAVHQGPQSIELDETLDVPGREGLRLQVLVMAATETPGTACVNQVCAKLRGGSTGADWTFAGELITQPATLEEPTDDTRSAGDTGSQGL